ncbi:MAG TPA: TolC family protein [Bacteriovoracaceae bacterium]|nr:TolC family protein [Bacteriovoracaceae bacterium]
MKLQLLGFVALVVLLIPCVGKTITLDNYLIEVAEKNGAVRGSKLSSESKALRLEESELFFRPSFFLTGEYYDDQRPTNAPTFQGTQTIRHTVRTGLSQNFRSGTKAAVSYNYFKTQILGANPAFLPVREFIDVAPMLEVSQSLWRNFLGSEFEASAVVQRSQTEAQKFNESFLHKQLLLQAENVYWRLYFAQTSLKVQKESLERARRLRDWNSGRVRSNLVDESELLQAEANLQNREIEYQDTLTEIVTALKEFNSMREGDGEIQLEGTKDKDSSYILNAKVPTKALLREDVRAAVASQRAATANAMLGTQRNRPNLEVYGSYTLNGRDGTALSQASDQSLTGTRPTSVVGVRFSTPLDLGSMLDFKKAYAQEVSASEMNYKRKAYEVEREWEILSERFKNFKTRLQMSKKLASIQEKKLSQEKRRYTKGRTTTFQVLQFEQDFANAQLLKLRNERELIAVYNQLKLFSGAPHE